MVDWEGRYVAGDTPWELGGVSPPLADLLGEYRASLGRVLMPGCGRGTDALYAARLGADVTGWDVAPAAIAAAQATARDQGLAATFAVRDALAPAPEAAGAFDTLAEHTFFCAIAPEQRPRYAAAAAELVRPGGRLLGVFLLGDRAQGPPYGATADELRRLFAPCFRIVRLEAATNTPPPWTGRELAAVLERL